MLERGVPLSLAQTIYFSKLNHNRRYEFNCKKRISSRGLQIIQLMLNAGLAANPMPFPYCKILGCTMYHVPITISVHCPVFAGSSVGGEVIGNYN